MSMSTCSARKDEAAAAIINACAREHGMDEDDWVAVAEALLTDEHIELFPTIYGHPSTYRGLLQLGELMHRCGLRGGMRITLNPFLEDPNIFLVLVPVEYVDRLREAMGIMGGHERVVGYADNGVVYASTWQYHQCLRTQRGGL